jgi:diacylglycerol kinase (ATP)
VGSGNDFARAIGLKSPSDSLTTWRKFCAGRGNIRNIDLGSIRASPDPDSETLFCCVAGAGLDAEANRRANAMPRWLRARGGYILALLAALSRFHPCQMTLHSAESPARLSECALVVAVANAPGYGNGMRIAPGASMEDGRLDACFVRPAGMLRLLRLFPRVYSGTHVGLPEVESLQSRCLRLESDVPMDIYADGEFAGRTPAEFRVVPGALPVIVA